MTRRKKLSKENIFNFDFVTRHVEEGMLIDDLVNIYGEPDIVEYLNVGERFNYCYKYTWLYENSNKKYELSCLRQEEFHCIQGRYYKESKK